MKLISLLTDFGLEDGFVGVMKGIILSIAPDTTIVDLDHEVAPQDILQGAYILGRVVSYFPSGAVHIAVVDPGVGTRRRPIAVRLTCQNRQYFCVGPDNGIFSYLYQQTMSQGGSVEVVHLDQPRYWLPEISNVFHGRDIFAPVAAHLVNGVPLHELGTPIFDAVRLELPSVEVLGRSVRGQVVSIDTFGNLLTNIERCHMADFQSPRVCISDSTIAGLVPTFGSHPPGELIALYDEEGFLMISIVNGNARSRLGSQVGDVVEVLAV